MKMKCMKRIIRWTLLEQKKQHNANGNRVKDVIKRLSDSDIVSIYNAVGLVVVVAPELIDWDAYLSFLCYGIG